ncbi:hypothetical protein HFP15_19755 [Amycolatopsis sp. K13G38]|uniref:Uncharacterized protein n=1 Tax=Amycolatopsis acididurans TaxID=2724524 RepID=A0ABX1J741_9PSEU|nr:hypothetical protein [Amycolatopsis acididurans]NKQ55121.1 hypothetical protein [Amycolatopsis acididurans]
MAKATEDSSDKSSLKPAQIAASALAAVTAAFLGSTLGVAGTVAGAGIASVVTTVGGELYLRSLRKTRLAARKTAEVLALTDTRLRQETRYVEPAGRRPGNPLMRPGPQPMRQGQLPPAQLDQIQRTQRIPMAGHGASNFGQRTVYIPRPGTQVPQQPGPRTAQAAHDAAQATRVIAPAKEQEGPAAEPPWWKNRWTIIAGSSVLAFVLGMLVLTGFEGITGKAVSGGQGTTFSQVVRGSSTGGGGTTNTPQTTTVTQTPASNTATPESSPAQKTGTSSASSTPTSQAPASSSVQQSESAQPQVTGSAAPTSG